MRIFNALKRGIERTETREHLTKTHKNVVQAPVIAIFQPTGMRAQMRDNRMTSHNNHVSADLLGPQVFQIVKSNFTSMHRILECPILSQDFNVVPGLESQNIQPADEN
jgi:hypothetical protein